MLNLNHDQFLDLARFIIANGRYSAFPGLDALRDCEEVHSPALCAESDVIFLKKDRPYALYESGFGFRVMPVSADVPLSTAQFSDLADWITGCGTFSGTLPFEVLSGCDRLEQPGCHEAHIDADQIFTRNGRPVALQVGDIGFIAVPMM